MISSATYRIQFNPEFGFGHVRRLLHYLQKLGISDLYASPIFAARPGSTHGYDVVDPGRLNPTLGTQDDFATLAAGLEQCNMGLLLDIVPNHMVAGSENAWWSDVLANGRESRWAVFFDIDWSAGGKIVLPVLDRSLRDALDAGELRIETDERGSRLRYHDHRFPLRVGTDAADVERALSQQHYKLAYWREASLNYRRFFDVGDLVGVRQEDEDVFQTTHALVLQLVESGTVSGLRVDHIDGLFDPAQYLALLANLVPTANLIVEKVLAGEERLPEVWPVAGTTGYEFLNAVNGLFVEPEGLDVLQGAYAEFTGRRRSFPDVVFDSKQQVVRDLFPAELRRLARELAAFASAEVSLEELADAVAVVAAAFPVYRTYISGPDVSPRDRDVIEQAVREARRRANGSVALDVLERVLALDVPAEQREACLRFVMRWQQFTGPIAAKGLEDTALYRYNALVSMNEVGADPGGLRAVSPVALHEFNIRRQEHTPHSLNATATHDTKRGEDVRARLNVLSELADEWVEHQRRWSELNSGLKTSLHGEHSPSANDETLIYQTLVGAWPLHDRELPEFRERLHAYVIKAAREAKERTSWLDPDQDYERALTGFAEALFASQPFLDALLPFQRRVAEHAVTNSLAQVVLKIASPGVPDIYQGTELWDLSLVDPDNRRPVDFAKRARLLDEISQSEPSIELAQELLSNWQEGRIKLYITHKCLSFRRANAALFSDGDYVPLEVVGRHAERVLAFARRNEDTWAVAVVPRLVAGLGFRSLGDVWRDTRIALPESAPGTWSNVFTGEPLAVLAGAISLRDAFAHMPVAMLSAFT